MSSPPLSRSPLPAQEDCQQSIQAVERPSGPYSRRGSEESVGHRSNLDPAGRKLSSLLNPFGISTFADGAYGFPPLTEIEIEEETEEDLVEFSCFDSIQDNHLQPQFSPSTLGTDSDPFCFPPIRYAQPANFPKVGPDQQASPEAYNPNYPSFVAPKSNRPFVVHVDEMPQPSTVLTTTTVPDLIHGEDSISGSSNAPAAPPRRPFRPRPGGKENMHRIPAMRRKPPPSNTADVRIRRSSFLKFSTMHPFPAPDSRHPAAHDAEFQDDESAGRGSVQQQSFRRTDAVGAYTLTKFLSQGAQGKVYLARSKELNRLSAIKVISKLTLENYHTLLQEQNLLKRIKGHPFVLNLLDSFHDTENFYLITDYYAGGDLAHLLDKLKIFETDMARFYIAELVVAIKFLHGNEIIHRDLKPSNVLIKADGHICIGDFGLCKDFYKSNSSPMTDGFAGTLVYMSPQVIAQELYSYETDWWSMGIILYELLQGDTPWTGPDVKSMMRKIKKEPLLFRRPIEDAVKDFLIKLLEKRVEDRLNSSHFATHPFFQSIDFHDVEAGLLTAPYIPSMREHAGPIVLKEKELVYVGRTYDIGVDPFPEYQYDFRLPQHSVDLEGLIDTLPAIDSSDQLATGDVQLPSTPKKTSPTGAAATLSNISPLKLDPMSPSHFASRNDAFQTPRRSGSGLIVSLSGKLMAISPAARSKFRRVYSIRHDESFLANTPNNASPVIRSGSPSPLPKTRGKGKGRVVDLLDVMLPPPPAPVLEEAAPAPTNLPPMFPALESGPPTAACLTSPSPTIFTAAQRPYSSIRSALTGSAGTTGSLLSTLGLGNSLFSVNRSKFKFSTLDGYMTEATIPSLSEQQKSTTSRSQGPASSLPLGSKLLSITAKAFSVDKVIVPLTMAPNPAADSVAPGITPTWPSSQNPIEEGTGTNTRRKSLAGADALQRAEPGFWMKAAFDAVKNVLSGLHPGPPPV
ncbi:kinase-like domain-containing protein [Coprinopsis sp. MPI-PUGE-AT-0042]|nr:kinase-like domain-containing protein [Coprinopsis sp. MPI-PUGE-AT-0042]